MPSVERGKKNNSVIRWWILPLSILLTVVLSAGMARGTAPSLAAPGVTASGTWLRITTNLSGSATLLSVYPDVAVSDDGKYVAVVWQEQHAGDTDVKTGHIYVRCVQEGSDQWWSAKDSVPGSHAPSEEGLGIIRGQTPAVALYGNEVHVVWSGGYDPNYNTIYYQKGTIGADNAVTWVSNLTPQEVANVADGKLTNPDIAVDSNGDPHVVWQQENDSGAKQIYYSYRDAGWATPQQVSNATGTDNRSPAIDVWKNDTTAHVAWVAREDVGSGLMAGRVYYAASSDWNSPHSVFGTSDSDKEARKPSIATWQGKEFRVGVAWDVWEDNNSDDEVNSGDSWRLYYSYTEDGGFTWDDYSPVGEHYPHYLDGDEYVQSLRPALTYHNLDPHLAVAETGGDLSDTMATYHYEYSGSSWDSEFMPWNSSKSGERGAASMVIADADYNGDKHWHYVYQAVVGTTVGGQNRWDVFYTSNANYNTVALPLVMRQAP